MPRRVISAVVLAAAVSLVASVASASAVPVWLCKPGLRDNPCTPGLSTTVYSPSLQRHGIYLPRAADPKTVDCFYVYPTVSAQRTGNANRHVDPAERLIALYQAARYSQFCNVYAPMYRQVTLAGIGAGAPPTTKPDPTLGLLDVRQAFAYYLRHFNHGRGFVLIGQSQGSIVLRRLVAHDIDARPAVRRHLLSAILLGGNVLVKPRSAGIGGDFKHIPACRTATQRSCVIAFSTFDQPVPANSQFGRSATRGEIVLCTNPAALSGGRGILNSIFPTASFAPGTLVNHLLHLTKPHPPTVWALLHGAYSARCANSGGAHVLEVAPVAGAPTPSPDPDPTWGLHLLDANIALGNLVRIVETEAAAYTAGSAALSTTRKPAPDRVTELARRPPRVRVAARV